MRLFRNPEVRLPLLTMLICAGLAAVALVLLNKYNVFPGDTLKIVGWSVAGTMVFCIAVTLITAGIHAKRVQDFTMKVDRNLHGQRNLQFDEFKEGDFAILQDVVQSMALAHARQEEQLEAEKGLLKQSLADITHQLKTPLASLSLTAEQLMEDEVSPAARKRAARKIVNTTTHIGTLVSTLLKLSRLDANVVTFRKDSFSAKKLIDEVCEPLETSMDLKEITLKKDIPPEIMLTSDLIWLKEALLNIVKNCMEHTPPEGTISISATENAVATEFVIRDTGPGISEEDLPHLFERFYRGKDADSNSVGIGLSFTNMVVRNLGGTVKVQNHPDGGAMFTVRMIKTNI